MATTERGRAQKLQRGLCVLRLLFLRLPDLHTSVARCSATILERITIEAWTIMVVTFPDDFATADNDTAVTIV
jgi:hypothetical protein